jgi:hypothetical protein
MDIDICCFDGIHLLGDSARYWPAPRSPHHAALLVLAWHADHGTGERVQLPFLG